jgi:hypothetical protein
MQQADISCCCLLGLNFYPEDGGGLSLLNVDEQASDYGCHICRIIGHKWSHKFVKENGWGLIENSCFLFPTLFFFWDISRFIMMDNEHAGIGFRVTVINYGKSHSRQHPGSRQSGIYAKRNIGCSNGQVNCAQVY